MRKSCEGSRRQFLKAAAGLPAAVAGAQPRRPNVVFILADDLGYGDLGCFNPESRIPTPHLDRFASQGVRFTDAHSPSAVCTPTRYGILTGRYCWRSRLKKGVLWGYSPALIEPGRLTVPSLLRRAGYQTAGFGKWHLGLGDREKTDYAQPLRPGPNQYGFEHYFGIPASLDMEPYLYFENDRAVEQPSGTIDGVRIDRGVFWRGGPIAPGFQHVEVLPTLTRRAAAWLRQPRSQPFFLYLALSAPHTPWLPTERFAGKSGAGEYGDFVAMVDDAVGQVLGALDDSGAAANTLTIVTSDNGAHWLPSEIARWNHRANGRLRGQKADIWDGGHRIPFMARWPGQIRAGTVSSELICLTDLMATVAELNGVRLPGDAAEDSYNILPALLGQPLGKPIREAVVHHSNLGHFAIRQGAWKLHLGRGSGGFSQPAEYTPGPGEPKGELFDLAKDPGETTNLYSRYPDIVDRLATLLEKYKREGRSRPR